MALPKLNKNALFLIGAIVLGLFAAMLSVNYVQKRVNEATAAAARPPVAETRVVVPRRDLVVGEVITESMLAMRNVPNDFVPGDALTPENYEQNLNRIVRAPIRGGTPVSASALVPLYDQFSRVIVAGKVGYTLSVNENNSISGMIAPGDSVDILLLYADDAGGAGGAARNPLIDPTKEGQRVVPLLENIMVLATGTRVGEMPTTGSDNMSYSSITLELDPLQAEQLTVGQKAGEIRILLRNIEDKTPFGLSGTTERDLKDALGGTGTDDVEYIIGGR